MPMIELDPPECGMLMAILANAEGKGITWQTVNPLLMKIGSQLRLQAEAAQRAPPNIAEHFSSIGGSNGQ
jgi:hypothetical protein